MIKKKLAKQKTAAPVKEEVKEKKAEPAKYDTFALSVEKQPNGYWSDVLYHIKDGAVVEKIIGEPGLRTSALAQFKVRAVRLFMA